MFGDRVGVDAARKVTDEEKVSEIAEFAGTFCEPVAGADDLRKKTLREWADPEDPPEPDA
jgi:hypothetical protein